MNVPLQTVHFDSPLPGPHLLITGGVHGDEFEGPAAIDRLRIQFESARFPLKRGRLTLVPIVNQPAFLRGERTAEDGLDLARVCPGNPEGSITERIACELSQLIRSADRYIDLHSGGRLFSILPMSGYVLHPDETVLNEQRSMAMSFNLPLIWGTSPHLNGRSLSVARDADIPAIYAEHSGAGQCNPQGVEDYIYGCLNVMASLGMIDFVNRDSLVELTIEDDRPESGHMQLCYPSPLMGLFEPAVQLGDHIKQEASLGRVFDPVTHRTETIHARQSGILFVARSFTRVKAGESVGVILETDRTSEFRVGGGSDETIPG
ncbi:M14 family metallopeptidase [Planctomycetaceae bacterium]|jgi:predicted deacylase|nr:M14 family metallopeptidase [Planctomycetaceae bacterium]MDG2390365.1 M14 family metallopeptidase [Planctomycetaceae bacterium]